MAAFSLGEFELLGPLGQGGMAEVSLARMTSGPMKGQEIAVKRLLPGLSSEVSVVRSFLEEADLGRQLKHPNVVRVLGAGEDREAPFIVMERIVGLDLRGLIQKVRAKSENLPVEMVLYLMHELALALRYVHEAKSESGMALGLVHCDVTPGNIYVTPEGRVILSDFGAAAATGMGANADVPAGKARYMAPEQILGHPLSPSTDLFALGAVMYELMTRHKAFSGASTESIWDKVVNGEVIAPSTVRADLPKSIDRLIARCLGVSYHQNTDSRMLRFVRALSPGKTPRFFSADSFLSELSEIFDLRPSLAASVGRFIQKLSKV